MDELMKETLSYIQKTPFQRTVMPYPYAFNLFCHESPMLEDDLVEEEKKVIIESQKILEEPDLAIHATCVRVPILRTHSEALNLQFELPITKELAYQTLSKAKGIRLLEDFSKNRFPMPCDAHGQEEVFYGRIRKDLSQKNALDIWVVGDQLLKGSALNAVQILQEVIRKRSIHAQLYTCNRSCCS
jgi:aspartate-semialdehyde dehydrogenase